MLSGRLQYQCRAAPRTPRRVLACCCGSRCRGGRETGSADEMAGGPRACRRGMAGHRFRRQAAAAPASLAAAPGAARILDLCADGSGGAAAGGERRPRVIPWRSPPNLERRHLAPANPGEDRPVQEHRQAGDCGPSNAVSSFRLKDLASPRRIAARSNCAPMDHRAGTGSSAGARLETVQAKGASFGPAAPARQAHHRDRCTGHRAAAGSRPVPDGRPRGPEEPHAARPDHAKACITEAFPAAGPCRVPPGRDLARRAPECGCPAP